MLTPSYAKQFERDMKLMRKRGKDLEKLKPVIRRLIAGEPLDAPQRDHKLIGNWQGRRECHIEPDWLLIYKLESERIVFERTGSHSDLFQK
jgi:mRNA interferase YafQ